VTTDAVSVTTVPLVTVLEESANVVVVGAPKAKLAGVATAARSRASTVEKTREREREPNF
jgi:hypothetical protein